MVSVRQQIEDAIRVVSNLKSVFTAKDVAAYANLEGEEKSVQAALQRHRSDEILNLDSPHAKATSNSRYIRNLEVERWWVRQTIRWAESGLNYLTIGQLAGTMSLAFDDRRWATPPRAILETGRRWAMVDDGSVPGTYISPWATVLRSNPQLEKIFLSIFDSQSEASQIKGHFDETYRQDQWQRTWDDEAATSVDHSAIIKATDKALNSLTDRQAEVIRGRFGLDTGHITTLEELGSDFGLTRERIRQIESKALNKLEGLPVWYYEFAIHFIRSGGSLLISESDTTPQWGLLSRSIGLNTVFIPEVGLHIIGTASDLKNYRSLLCSITPYFNDTSKGLSQPVHEEMQFLSRQDLIRLRAAEREFQIKESSRTRPRMAFHAMRSLGRAAHFQEIAEKCNELFPERQCSTHSWHESLLRPEALSLGIVWIGKKGIYGLEEQGYSRPTRDMFDAVASIVEARFAHTGQPVPFDFVMRELNNERQDPDPNSVNIALSINNRLASKGSGRYVPIAQTSSKSSVPSSTRYDLDAGFDAFTSSN